MKTPEQIRKEKNDALLERYHAGETLSYIDPSATWFPPRPMIEKDKSLVAKLYGENNGDE